jgi:hypothetical protein
LIDLPVYGKSVGWCAVCRRSVCSCAVCRRSSVVLIDADGGFTVVLIDDRRNVDGCVD